MYEDLIQFLVVGEVILLGDFNAPTRDRSKDALCLKEIDLVSVDLHRVSDDMLGPLSTYGKHLLHLASPIN